MDSMTEGRVVRALEGMARTLNDIRDELRNINQTQGQK